MKESPKKKYNLLLMYHFLHKIFQILPKNLQDLISTFPCSSPQSNKTHIAKSAVPEKSAIYIQRNGLWEN